jgi:hypothetical protein
MGEAKSGKEFITHEFDEAIALQQAIVDGAETLAKDHSRAESKHAIKAGLETDREHLQMLRKFGKAHDATGKAEGVAAAMKTLMEDTAESAGEAPSEAYEAQAVLIALKRKQQDSAGAFVRIARDLDDTQLRDAAVEFGRATKTSADALADDLSWFAVELATAREVAASRR